MRIKRWKTLAERGYVRHENLPGMVQWLSQDGRDSRVVCDATYFPPTLSDGTAKGPWLRQIEAIAFELPGILGPMGEESSALNWPRPMTSVGNLHQFGETMIDGYNAIRLRGEEAEARALALLERAYAEHETWERTQAAYAAEREAWERDEDMEPPVDPYDFEHDLLDEPRYADAV